jgi:hypothetical protein
MCRLSWNLGASTSWNPQSLSWPVMGLLYLRTFTLLIYSCSPYAFAAWTRSPLGFALPDSCSFGFPTVETQIPHVKGRFITDVIGRYCCTRCDAATYRGDRDCAGHLVVSPVWWSKSGTPVLTERLVTEGNWYEAPTGHLTIDIHESNQNSWREE